MNICTLIMALLISVSGSVFAEPIKVPVESLRSMASKTIQAQRKMLKNEESNPENASVKDKIKNRIRALTVELQRRGVEEAPAI